MHHPPKHKQYTHHTPHQFDTFRTHPPAEEEGQDYEKEQMLMRIQQLEEQIGRINGRATHLQTLNDKLNQIIVNYHTKNNIKFEQFLQKVHHLVSKRNTNPSQNKSMDKKSDSLHKNQTKVNKCSSIKKISNNQQICSFAKMKTQQAITVYDENNSFVGNVYNPMSRSELRKKVGSKMCDTLK